MSKYQYFSANTQGRDFVCSDIHGYFDVLEKMLALSNFNPEVDRLFSLGDLIDRGPMSELVLEYMSYDWFYPILGNHEFMLLEAYESKKNKAFQRWYSWGGTWAQNLSRDKLQPYYDAFVQLPIALEIQLPDQRRVGLVHAEIPANLSWDAIRKNLMDFPPGAFDLADPFIVPLLWSKSLYLDLVKHKLRVAPVADIDHVFHGHSIVESQPLTIGNRTYLDLGSYLSGEIGFINLSSQPSR